MAEITQASQEQTSGLDQINEAISQMDSITQHNVALVEQAAAAADSLQDQSATLIEVVSVFKLDAMGAAPARPAPVAAPTLVDGRRLVATGRQPAAAKRRAAGGADWETF